jgi:phosphoribosylformimino-5-aminoimidazole carboxamide ribotide isomerase
MLVIPAIDIHNGKCVRLFQGDFAKVTEYSDDPCWTARRWANKGAQMLHVVDLDGAKEGRPVNLGIVRRIAADTGLPVQVGGGFRTPEDVESAFAAGAARVILGTAACCDPIMLRRLVRRFGEDRILVSIDCNHGMVMTDGWLRSSSLSPQELAARALDSGIRTVVYMDVSRDGTLGGVDVDSIAQLLSTGVGVIAAGGVGSIQDLRRLKTLETRGVKGVIIGRALYTGAIKFANALRAAGSRRIIPCLDTESGRVVKGVNFKNLKDAGDPVELATVYEGQGADELMLLDVSATDEGRRTALDVVGRVASAISVPLGVGGGIRSVDDIGQVLDAGASKVCINTAAVQDPELLQLASDAFGAERIISAIDASAATAAYPDAMDGDGSGSGRWVVCACGGKQCTRLDLIEWARAVERLGVGEILLTSVDRDGATDGYDLRQLRAVTEAVSIPVIASGGAGSLEHFRDAFVKGGADAALAASVFHFAVLSVEDVKSYLRQEGVDVR